MTNEEHSTTTMLMLVGLKLFTGAALIGRILLPEMKLFLVWNTLLALVCGFGYKYTAQVM